MALLRAAQRMLMIWSTSHRALCHQVWTPQQLPYLPGTYYAFHPWVLQQEVEGSKAHPLSLPWRFGSDVGNTSHLLENRNEITGQKLCWSADSQHEKKLPLATVVREVSLVEVSTLLFFLLVLLLSKK